MIPAFPLSFISCKTGCFVALTEITPSKGRDWKKNSTLTRPNSWRSYLTLQLLCIWICSGKQPNEQMWLRLLSLLFDQTVTTENTSTFLDGDVLCSSALGFCCTNAMTSSIDIENISSQPHILHQECSENKYVWGYNDQLLEMFNPPTLFWPSSNILLLNVSASLKWNSVPRVWRLLNKEQLQNCQCLLLPPR